MEVRFYRGIKKLRLHSEANNKNAYYYMKCILVDRARRIFDSQSPEYNRRIKRKKGKFLAKLTLFCSGSPGRTLAKLFSVHFGFNMSPIEKTHPRIKYLIYRA